MASNRPKHVVEILKTCNVLATCVISEYMEDSNDFFIYFSIYLYYIFNIYLITLPCLVFSDTLLNCRIVERVLVFPFHKSSCLLLSTTMSQLFILLLSTTMSQLILLLFILLLSATMSQLFIILDHF